jgi:hypothetical protein
MEDLFHEIDIPCLILGRKEVMGLEGYPLFDRAGKGFVLVLNHLCKILNDEFESRKALGEMGCNLSVGASDLGAN